MDYRIHGSCEIQFESWSWRHSSLLYTSNTTVIGEHNARESNGHAMLPQGFHLPPFIAVSGVISVQSSWDCFNCEVGRSLDIDRQNKRDVSRRLVFFNRKPRPIAAAPIISTRIQRFMRGILFFQTQWLDRTRMIQCCVARKPDWLWWTCMIYNWQAVSITFLLYPALFNVADVSRYRCF